MSEPESVPPLSRLAARAQLGDRAAMETLLIRLADQLRPYLQHLVSDSDQAEDVLQDVLLRVARKLPTLREHAWIRAWAFRIASRDAMRHVARRRRHALVSLDEASELPAVDENESSEIDPAVLTDLLSAVASLPPRCQIVVRLHYLHGLTQPEVAEVLSIPIGTVKSRIAYGLRMLRGRVVVKGR